jgi:hypothetical protein
MQSDTVGQACIDEGHAVVEPSIRARGQSLSEPPNVVLIAELEGDLLQTVATVDPHLGRPVDKNVGDARLTQQPLERPRAGDLGSEPLGDVENSGISEDCSFSP